jgi:hypothetical protein
MAMRTLVLVAVAVAFLGVTLYVTLDARDTVAEILACPLQVEERAQHPGMVWIPGGTFEMGGDVYPEEGPRRTVSVDGFWMDRTEVTNADFAVFVKETNYVTVAERAANPGAAVFVMPSGDADLSTAAAWWSYVKGANWRHPGGPGTSTETRDHFPVTDRSPMGVGRPRRKTTSRRTRTAEGRQHVARRLPANQHERRRFHRHRPRRLLQSERLRPQRHDRQRLGMDGRHLRRPRAQSARDQRRLIPLRRKLLRAVPPASPPAARSRPRHQPPRLPHGPQRTRPELKQPHLERRKEKRHAPEQHRGKQPRNPVAYPAVPEVRNRKCQIDEGNHAQRDRDRQILIDVRFRHAPNAPN